MTFLTVNLSYVHNERRCYMNT